MALPAHSRDPFRHLHNRIRRERLLNPNVILHFDSIRGDLDIWKWPIINSSNGTSVRVTPDNLEEHRRTHAFRAPSCLCASAPSGDHYTECAVYIPDAGRHLGEYVAGCAENRCNYLVALDRLYPRRGLRVWMYGRRVAGAEIPPIIYAPFRGSDRQRHNIRRVTLTSIPRYDRPTRRPETVLDQLFRLDAWEGPGLPELQFRRMFAQCQCGLVMTCRAFRNHVCAVRTPPIIDLTLDSDTSSIVIDLTADSDDE